MQTFEKIIDAGQCMCGGATLMYVGFTGGSVLSSGVAGLGVSAVAAILVVKGVVNGIFDKLGVKSSTFRELNEWAITLIAVGSAAAFAATSLGFSSTLGGGLWLTTKSALIIATAAMGVILGAAGIAKVCEIATGRKILPA